MGVAGCCPETSRHVGVVAGVSARREPGCRAECNKAPFMYEMKGALSASPHQIGRLPGLPGAARRPPVPGTRTNHRLPGDPRVPGCPRMVPVSNGKSIFTPLREFAQGSAGVHFWFFSCPHAIHKNSGGYPHAATVIHRLCTTCPQVTWRNSENTGLRSPYVIARYFPGIVL